MPNFAGRWLTTFGQMQLKQHRNQVSGIYQMGPHQCSLQGEIRNGKLVFVYREPGIEGEGWFELFEPGKFRGKWRPLGGVAWDSWEGAQIANGTAKPAVPGEPAGTSPQPISFDGLWQTSFGPVRLNQDRDTVTGCYELGGPASISGRVQNGRLRFRYQEATVGGEGWFEMGADGRHFAGQWQETGATEWKPWQGDRLDPTPGVTWLIVLEAHWQDHLLDREYAFGNMLREFFARVPGVHVRQRFFNNAEGLEKWCRELVYLPDPAVVVLATHALREGLTPHGKLITSPEWANLLGSAGNLKLLHFSACKIMEDAENSPWYQALQKRCPVSGYTTTVDWAASALTEFLFLDLILSKKLAPAAAAEQIVKLIGFAGDTVPDGCPYPAARFRFLAPTS